MTQSILLNRPRTSKTISNESYWRDSDKYNQKEYVLDQFRRAKVEFQHAENELSQVQNKLNEKSAILNDKNNYYKRLETATGKDTTKSQEIELRKKLYDIEVQIKEAQAKSDQLNKMRSPSYFSNLFQEKTAISLESQRITSQIEELDELIDDRVIKLAQLCISDKTQSAYSLEVHYSKGQHKYKHLRDKVSRLKNDLDLMQPIKPLSPDCEKELRDFCSEMMNERMILYNIEEKYNQKIYRYNEDINNLLGQIEELNLRMMDLGMDEGNLVDVEELKKKYIKSTKGRTQTLRNSGEIKTRQANERNNKNTNTNKNKNTNTNTNTPNKRMIQVTPVKNNTEIITQSISYIPNPNKTPTVLRRLAERTQYIYVVTKSSKTDKLSSGSLSEGGAQDDDDETVLKSIIDAALHENMVEKKETNQRVRFSNIDQ